MSEVSSSDSGLHGGFSKGDGKGMFHEPRRRVVLVRCSQRTAITIAACAGAASCAFWFGINPDKSMPSNLLGGAFSGTVAFLVGNVMRERGYFENRDEFKVGYPQDYQGNRVEVSSRFQPSYPAPSASSFSPEQAREPYSFSFPVSPNSSSLSEEAYSFSSPASSSPSFSSEGSLFTSNPSFSSQESYSFSSPSSSNPGSFNPASSNPPSFVSFSSSGVEENPFRVEDLFVGSQAVDEKHRVIDVEVEEGDDLGDSLWSEAFAVR